MALTKTFGSVDTFRDQLSAASVSVMGSGWGWLGYCPRTGQLRISTSPNQEPLDLPSSGDRLSFEQIVPPSLKYGKFL